MIYTGDTVELVINDKVVIGTLKKYEIRHEMLYAIVQPEGQHIHIACIAIREDIKLHKSNRKTVCKLN